MTPQLLVAGVAVLVLFPSSASAEEPATAPKFATDEAASADSSAPIGRCGAYVSTNGSAKIVRVEKTAASTEQATSGGGPGYAGFEVWFSFTPDEPVSDPATADWIGREYELRLANSWYPGPEFLKKYGLQVGDTIAAVLDAQKAGPCTPFVFQFPSVDTTDYFERGR